MAQGFLSPVFGQVFRREQVKDYLEDSVKMCPLVQKGGCRGSAFGC